MLELRVNGRAYGGWKSARVTRGIESIAGGFALAVSERWSGQSERWPIAEEDGCALSLDGQTVITGYVDRRSLLISADDHSVSVEGRDAAAALVDCSATPGEFRNVSLLTFARRLADPFGVVVSLQAGLVLPASMSKLSVDPGETAFSSLEKACRLAAVLPVSDGRGGIVLTRAGAGRATTELVEGVNILSAASRFDATGRFARYLVRGAHPGSDQWYGESAVSVKGEARDENVRRTSRVLIVRPEGNVTADYAKRRAQWEARVRAARGDDVSVTVQGWTQGDGSLWPVNALVNVRAPSIEVDGTLLIAEVSYNLDDSSGTTTELTLRRPDAYLEEPTAVVSKKATGLWKEIAAGV